MMTESNPVSYRNLRLRANLCALVHSRAFHTFFILLVIYGGTMVYFILVIQPELGKVPFESPATWVRDLIWILGWRYNLDYLIIIGFLLVVVLETGLYSVALSRSRDAGKLANRLSIYVSPAVNFGFAYLYMLAIDLGVTYFADLGFNGTWESPVILWL